MLSVVVVQVGATQIALRLLEIFVIALPLVGVFAQLVFSRLVDESDTDQRTITLAFFTLLGSTSFLILSSGLVVLFLILRGLPPALVIAAITFVYALLLVFVTVSAVAAPYLNPEPLSEYDYYTWSTSDE